MTTTPTRSQSMFGNNTLAVQLICVDVNKVDCDRLRCLIPGAGTRYHEALHKATASNTVGFLTFGDDLKFSDSIVRNLRGSHKCFANVKTAWADLSLGGCGPSKLIGSSSRMLDDDPLDLEEHTPTHSSDAMLESFCSVEDTAADVPFVVGQCYPQRQPRYPNVLFQTLRIGNCGGDAPTLYHDGYVH